ncbi:hypothetical protein HanIR_Chr06g0272531 [Helianthus annuus]|nr:hypothetical protein HanIR_Chr06g0272531 [Helianthus annuus]
MLHIIHTLPKKQPQNPQKLRQHIRQLTARENLQQIPKIIRAVKRHPTHRVTTHQPG